MMKYRNKHYLEIGMLPVVLFPFIALTIGLTLWTSKSATPDRYDYLYGLNRYDNNKNKLLAYGNPLDEDGDDCEKVIFDFTQDTVLMLKGTDLFNVAPGRRKVIYKTKQGVLNTIDVPFSQLTEISSDTSAVKE